MSLYQAAKLSRLNMCVNISAHVQHSVNIFMCIHTCRPFPQIFHIYAGGGMHCIQMLRAMIMGNAQLYYELKSSMVGFY